MGYAYLELVLPGVDNDEPFLILPTDYALVFFLEALPHTSLLKEGDQFLLIAYTPESRIPAGRGRYIVLKNGGIRVEQETGELYHLLEDYILTTIKDRYHNLPPQNW